MKLDHEKILNEAPPARGAAVIFCTSPLCRRPHIVLFDEHDKPMAQWVVPDVEIGKPGFFTTLQDAMYRGAVEKDDK